MALKEDRAITLTEVNRDDANYWDTVHGKLISLFKIATSVTTGKRQMTAFKAVLPFNMSN